LILKILIIKVILLNENCELDKKKLVTLLIEQVLDEEETERVQQIENQYKMAKAYIKELLSRHESAEQE
jgi:hypothetical protein